MNSVNQKAVGHSGKAGLILSCMALCVLTVSGLQGCNRSEVESEPSAETIEEPVVISLESSFAGLAPDELEINVPRDLPISDINEWAEQMLRDMIDQEVDEEKLAESLSELLPDDVVERVLRRRFVLRDANHIRDCLWARELTQKIIADSRSETDRIVDLFYFVVNTIPIVPVDETLPFGPFESAFYGRGTAEDRAWTFATLLKQQRIPTVVLVQQSSVPADVDSTDANHASTAEPTGNLIVGALLNESLYLFDATLGLPIAGPGDAGESPLCRQPATLAQVLDDPKLLSRMGDEETAPYGVTRESLRNSQPLVIGDSTLWSRRMEGLQRGMPAEAAASIFEPLVSHGIYEGTVEHVAAHLANVLPGQDTGVWLYPERQREARELVSRNTEQSSRLAELSDTFKVPEPLLVGAVPDEDNPEVKRLAVTFGPSWGVHRDGRVDQILGRPEQAIPAYLKVQDWRTLPPSPKDSPPIDADVKPLVIQKIPQEVRDRHALAAEEALIWRATCQMQKGSFESASAALEGYLRQLQLRSGLYSGRFRDEASYLLGISLAMTGNSRRGVAFLKNIGTGSSRYPTAQALIRRWAAMSKQAQ